MTSRHGPSSLRDEMYSEAALRVIELLGAGWTGPNQYSHSEWTTDRRPLTQRKHPALMRKLDQRRSAAELTSREVKALVDGARDIVVVELAPILRTPPSSKRSSASH